MSATSQKWTLSKLPPEGHVDVGQFAWGLFEMSQAEKERLNLPTRWIENHRLWRGGSVASSFKSKNAITANLVFSNINRTVANLTAKNPVAEVVSLDGGYMLDEQGQPILDERGEPIPDDTDAKMTEKLKGWWNESEQNNSLVDTALQMETYGITIEKAIYDINENRGDVVVIDPFSFVICPGYFETLNDAPFVGQAYPETCDSIESLYELDDGTVTPEDVFTLMGQEREDNRPTISGTRPGTTAAPSNYGNGVTYHMAQQSNGGIDRALVVEIWVRDYTKAPIYEEMITVIDDGGGDDTKIKTKITKKKVGERLKYPGGIRVITVTNQGELVLADRPNPNVNPELSSEEQANTFLYDKFPFWHGVSYKDTTSLWGFAAAEQVGDLAEKCSELLSRVYRYLARVMLPPLIIPADTGLTENDVNNDPGLVLTPNSSATSGSIRFVQVPNLPNDTWQIFDKLQSMFDRVYQIEDADRGDTPNRIVAASAIVALQERNAVLMRHKIRAIDYLIRQRGRAAISFFQNFGVVSEPVKVDDTLHSIRGVDHVGRKFQFVVESGSTIPQTTLQVKEMALDLAKMGKIDTHGLLETLQFPGWRRIVERMAEAGDNLDQAAQIFIEAGVDEQTITQLVQFARQPQGGPGAGQPQQQQSKQPQPPEPMVTGG